MYWLFIKYNSMATRIVEYNLEFFENLIFNGIDYTLEHSILDKIEDISKQVSSPEYVKTPQFQTKNFEHNKNHKYKHHADGHHVDSHHKYHGKKRHYHSEVKAEDWEAIRKFETTKMKKSEGIDLSIDSIRKKLNKITDKNYDTFVIKIIEELDVLQDEYDLVSTKGELSKISNSIFKIASGNTFYSELYAKLYKMLYEKYEFIRNDFMNHFDDFKTIFKNINYCDPNENYDLFCENNKNNEKRRSLGLFYVNLSKHNIIQREKVIEIIYDIQKYMIDLMLKENNKPLVEELSELLYIMVVNGNATFKDDETFDEIIEIITDVSKYNVKEYPSLSNKTKFKHMDILDELN